MSNDNVGWELDTLGRQLGSYKGEVLDLESRVDWSERFVANTTATSGRSGTKRPKLPNSCKGKSKNTHRPSRDYVALLDYSRRLSLL